MIVGLVRSYLDVLSTLLINVGFPNPFFLLNHNMFLFALALKNINFLPPNPVPPSSPAPSIKAYPTPKSKSPTSHLNSAYSTISLLPSPSKPRALYSTPKSKSPISHLNSAYSTISLSLSPSKPGALFSRISSSTTQCNIPTPCPLQVSQSIQGHTCGT